MNEVNGKLSPTYFVYMVECADGTLYTGYTVNLQRRLAAHNRGRGAKYTRGRTPVRLVYCEEYPDKGEAMRREHWLKQCTRQDKCKLAKTWSLSGYAKKNNKEGAK